MRRIITILFCLAMFGSCKKTAHEKNVPLEGKPVIEARTLDEVSVSSGTIERIENFPSEFVQPRNVDVWLPDHYSEDEKFAVLYMHDGQMLFDSTTTWNKQEWKVDEWASKLMKEGKTRDFIVVALWNISEIRWQDYFPEKVWDYLPEEIQIQYENEAKKNNLKIELNADDYLKFITEEVKPFIDLNYSVYNDRDNTFLSGSSMGGLISMYAVCEYPEVFGGAACISTHWPGTSPHEDNPYPDAFFSYMKEHTPDPGSNRFYFDYGTETLDAHYPQYADEVDAVFYEKGYDEYNYKNLKFEGAAHDENSWNARLDIPLTFLLGN